MRLWSTTLERERKIVLCLPVLAEQVEEVLHVGGQGGFEFDALARRRVGEFQGLRVQGDPVDHGLFDGRFGVGQLPGVDELAAVHVVGHDRVLDVGQVDADLVRPAGVRRELQE